MQRCPGLFHMWPNLFQGGCGILVVGGALKRLADLVLDLAGLFAGGAITFQWRIQAYAGS